MHRWRHKQIHRDTYVRVRHATYTSKISKTMLTMSPDGPKSLRGIDRLVATTCCKSVRCFAPRVSLRQRCLPGSRRCHDDLPIPNPVCKTRPNPYDADANDAAQNNCWPAHGFTYACAWQAALAPSTWPRRRNPHASPARRVLRPERWPSCSS